MKNYTDIDIINHVKTSTSFRQVLSKLGLKEAGGNYQCLKQSIKRLNIDVSHFTGQATNKGKKFGYKRPLSDYLNNLNPIQSYKLKNRLLKERIFEHKCYNCNLTNWLEQPIPLELEHIDGNHLNNSLSNLTLLCPNCHAMTPTYRGKNIKTNKISNI